MTIDEQREALRVSVANLIARSEWGSMCPEIGVDDDAPGGVLDRNWLAADAAIAVVLRRAAEVAGFEGAASEVRRAILALMPLALGRDEG